MRRLTGALAGRLREERGAIAVATALFLIVLLGFAAVAIDTAAARRDQQLLRNAADAAALAVALDCAESVPFDRDAPLPTVCPRTAADRATATATRLAVENSGPGSTVAASLEGRTVTVTVSAPYSRPIPIGPGTVSVSATAEWTPASIRVPSHAPLAISYCRYAALPAGSPSRLPAEPGGLWLLPARQEITPAAWTGSDSCAGPDGALVLPSRVMTSADADAECGTSSVRGADVVGQAFEPVALASRTCVANSQFGDVTSWPWGGYQIVVPVYDQVRGNRYRVWDYLGFHVMGIAADGALWGFSTGKADLAFAETVPLSVRLTG